MRDAAASSPESRPLAPSILRSAAFAVSITLAAGMPKPADAAGLYRAMPLAGAGTMARLAAEMGKGRFLETLKLNRVDQAHAVRLDTLIVAEPEAAFIDLSPFPRAWSGVDSVPQLLLVSLRVQAFGAYERGTLIRWGPISSGGPNSPSKPGVYHATWKDRLHVSSVDSTWIMPWTVNIDPRQGTALHQYSLPGHPASHCCIRLLKDDARWIYDWITTWKVAKDDRTVLARGTPVLLVGEYAFDGPPPWTRLPAEPDAAKVRPDELQAALDYLGEADAGESP